MTARRSQAIAHAARHSRTRTLLAFFTAFAFLLQSLIVQTHIHGASLTGPGLSGLLAKLSTFDEPAPLAKAPAKQHAPKNDETSCPFCQAAQIAGSFVAPAAIVLLVPWQNVSLVPLFLASKAHVSTTSHDWHGRAPPHA